MWRFLTAFFEAEDSRLSRCACRFVVSKGILAPAYLPDPADIAPGLNTGKLSYGPMIGVEAHPGWEDTSVARDSEGPKVAFIAVRP